MAATSGHLDTDMAGLRGTLGLRRTLDRAVSCQAWSRAPAVACAAGAGGAGSGVRAPTGYGEAAAPSGSAGTDAEQTAALPDSGLQDVGDRRTEEEGGGPGQCAGAAPLAGGRTGAGSLPDGWAACDAAEQGAGLRDPGGAGGQAAGRAPWPRARRGAGACTVGAGRRVVGLAEDAAARPRCSGARGAAGTPNPNFTPQEELAGRLAGAEAELAGLAADLAARDAEAAALARALAGARRALGVGGAPSGAGGAQRWHAGRMPAPLSMRRRGRTYQRCERCGSVSRGGTFPSIAAMQPHISWLHLLQY